MADDATADAAEFLEQYLSETVRIGSQGERRARYVEWSGAVAVMLAIISMVGGIIAAAAADDEDVAQFVIVLWALIASGWWLVVAAVLYGFSSIVRNSSRSLSIQALTSELDDDGS